MTADQAKVAAAVAQGDAAAPRGGEERGGIHGRQRQVTREAEGPAARQQEAVPGTEGYRLGNPFQRKPAVVRDHRVTLDALVAGKAHRPVTAGTEA